MNNKVLEILAAMKSKPYRPMLHHDLYGVSKDHKAITNAVAIHKLREENKKKGLI